MKIVLLEYVEKLGSMGSLVTVKGGYARNHLLPKGRALRASKANVAAFEARRAVLEAENAERKRDAAALKAEIDGQIFVLIRAAGDSKQLYGSVAARDVAARLKEAGYDVPRNRIILERPIKTIGLHPVTVTPHPEVAISVILNVARTPEEAERALSPDAEAEDGDADPDAETPYDDSLPTEEEPFRPLTADRIGEEPDAGDA